MTNRPSCILVVDGGVDLPPELIKTYGLEIVPLAVHFGNETYRSGVDMTPLEFYERLKERGEFPTTSQPSAGEYYQAYQRAAESGLPILSIHLSAGLSGSFNAARTAKEMLPDLEITQVDTLTLSGEMGMQVLVAAEMARLGMPISAIVETLQGIHSKTRLYFTLDKLDHLRKGGRIGRVAGAVGSLLGIRPIVMVDKVTGTYVPVGKARSYRKAIEEMAERVISEVGEGQQASVMVLEAYSPNEIEHFKSILKSRLNVVWFQHLPVNPGLGAHTGVDGMGVAYYPGALPFLVQGEAAAD